MAQDTSPSVLPAPLTPLASASHHLLRAADSSSAATPAKGTLVTPLSDRAAHSDSTLATSEPGLGPGWVGLPMAGLEE